MQKRKIVMQNDEICKERDDYSMKFVFIFYTLKNQRIILRYSH